MQAGPVSVRPRGPAVRVRAFAVRALLAARRALLAFVRRSVPPDVALLELVAALAPALALCAVHRVGVAEAMGDARWSARDLAERIDCDADALARVLRLLAGFGVFHEHRDGRFSCTALGRRLASDSPDGVAPVLRYLSAPWQQVPWIRLDETLRTGTPSFELAEGVPFFEFLERKPDASETFDAAIAAFAAPVADALPRTLALQGVARIVDVGGGRGAFLAALLAANPTLRGTLFDLPQVVRAAEPFLRGAGVVDRCELCAGDFFADLPANGDLYVLAHVLHDWSDADCARILAVCRRAMPPRARLLVVERALGPPGRSSDPTVAVPDVQMMLFLRGRERTVEEFRALLRSTGFALERAIQTPVLEWALVFAPV